MQLQFHLHCPQVRQSKVGSFRIQQQRRHGPQCTTIKAYRKFPGRRVFYCTLKTRVRNMRHCLKMVRQTSAFFTIQSAGEFPTSPSACPTSPLVTDNAPPVFSLVSFGPLRTSNKSRTAATAALYVTHRADTQPIGRRLSPRTRDFDLAAIQLHAAQVCRLMVSTLVIHG